MDFVPLLPLGSVISAFTESNLAGQVIVVLLLVGSVFAWSVMVTKWRELSLAKAASGQFLAAYRREAAPAALFLKRQRFAASPLFEFYGAVCRSLGSMLEAAGVNPDDLFMGGVGVPQDALSARQMNTVKCAADKAVADLALRLESAMGFLATAVSAAPFLGLLGTVWGVMDSFMAISRDKGFALLSDVAPGVAGALLTTVVGLLVALPSAIGYNLLNERIRHLTVLLENFAQEVMADMERSYLP